MNMNDNTTRIRVLNDHFRRTLTCGSVVLTRGVASFDRPAVAQGGAGSSERIVSCGMLFALPWTRRQSAADDYAPDKLDDALKAQLPNVDFIAWMDLENPHFTFDVNAKKVQSSFLACYILGRVLFRGIDAGEARG